MSAGTAAQISIRIGRMPGTPIERKFKSGATLESAIRTSELKVGGGEEALVNGEVAPMDRVLEEGDVVTIGERTQGGSR